MHCSMRACCGKVLLKVRLEGGLDAPPQGGRDRMIFKVVLKALLDAPLNTSLQWQALFKGRLNGGFDAPLKA